MNTPCLVLSTVSSPDAAVTIAKLLVEKELAACVNIVPGIESIYKWEGKLCQEKELLLIIKASTEVYPDLEASLRAVHPYEIPEIVMIPISVGSRDYLDWILHCVRPIS
jgi:periplasmic divalent cation tolerance protein